MKIFEAYRKEGQVYNSGGLVPDCPVLGEGGDSEGWLIMAEGEFVYIPKRSPDLSTTLQLLSTTLSTIGTGIFQANLGGDITKPTFASDIAEIKNKVDDLRGKLNDRCIF